MKYYAIADLHGRYDLLQKALTAIHADVGDLSPIEDYKIVTLGDYIDRGPDSMSIINTLKDSNIVCLQGNHESIMVESIYTPLMPMWWVGNGGDTTLQSYGWGGEPYNIYAYEMVPKAHLEWVKNLPIFYETEKQVFVHAGIPQWDMNLPPTSKHLIEQMQWMLYDKRTAGGWKGKHVVHGHHQFKDGPHVWYSAKGGRTNLDTYAWKTGRLVIGVFDDTQGPAKKFIEVVGDDNGYQRKNIDV